MEFIIPFYVFSSVLILGFIAKQRINSGFFLYEAEMKKQKREKTEKRINQKSKRMQKFEGVYGLFR